LKRVLFAFVVLACAVAAPVFGQGQQKSVSGAVYVFVSPATTSLDAQGITGVLEAATGKQTYQNDGNYPGFAVYAHFPRKLGVDFALFTGTSETIDPEIANYYRGMNPLTHEHIVLWDASGTYTLYAGQHGIVDAMAGVLSLWADPGAMTVPMDPMSGNFNPFVIDNGPTTYRGFALGMKGYYPLHQIVGIDYKFQYLPTYSVNGHYANAGADSLSPRNVIRYRFGGNVYLNRRFGLTVGYQGIRLGAELEQGPSKGTKAIVKNYGPYFGGMVNF
jgi:hypothetical protein